MAVICLNRPRPGFKLERLDIIDMHIKAQLFGPPTTLWVGTFLNFIVLQKLYT